MRVLSSRKGLIHKIEYEILTEKIYDEVNQSYIEQQILCCGVTTETELHLGQLRYDDLSLRAKQHLREMVLH